MCVGSRSGVSPTFTEIGTCLFSKVSASDPLVPFVDSCPGTLRNHRNSIRIAFCLPLEDCYYSVYIKGTRQSLDYIVSSLSEGPCTCYSLSTPVFTCFITVEDNCFTIRVTPLTAMPVTAVILRYSFCFWVVPVRRKPLNVPLPSIATHSVMDMSFPPFTFLF